jgi:hypothetical protein
MIDDGGMQIASKENTFGEAAPSVRHGQAKDSQS